MKQETIAMAAQDLTRLKIVETLRQLMIKAELWRPIRQRKPRVYQQRQRRERFGELIQADGSSS